MIVNHTMKTYSNSIKNEAMSLRKKDWSIPKIANHLGVSNTSVARWTRDIEATFLSHPLYKTKHIIHDYFSPNNLKKFPERLVLVGFIAADGCISDTSPGQKRLQFNLSKKDKTVLDIFNNELCNGTRSISNVIKTNSCIFYLPSNQICNDLSRYGIIPRKTASYSLPYFSKNNMSYFLRGYFYGDGCVYRNGRESIYHLVGTTDFIINVKEFLIKNNILEKCGIYSIKNKPAYKQMHIKGRHQVTMFGNWLFENENMNILPRKHVRLFSE